MKKKITRILIVLTLAVFLTGCRSSNKKDYNNRVELLWGVVSWTTSGGEGTDDAPALGTDNPETHIDQKGSNGNIFNP